MIKILFLAANPLDTDRLHLDEEMRAIDAAIRQGAYRDQFDIRSHWAVRIEDLQELLLRHQPDIVHFSGHGSRAGGIMLQNEQANTVMVTTDALGHLFSLLKDNIRCVVLSACYSDVQASSIAQHIDCVVGMSNAISDPAALSFAAAFYRALGYGRNMQTAFDLGCSQLDLSQISEMNQPQLIANHVDPTQVILAKEITPLPLSGGDSIQARIGVLIAALIVIAGIAIWYGRGVQQNPFSSPITVILGSAPPPSPTRELFAFAPATPEETLIIVPEYDNRSEGQIRGVNPSSQIYDLVFKAGLDNHESKVRVEYYKQVVSNSEQAQTLGAQYNAKIVLWGWYNSLKVQPYVELVGDRTIQGDGMPIATPTPLAFYFLEEIPAQAAYLGLFMMGMAHVVIESQTDLRQAIAFFSSALNAVGSGIQTNPWEAYVWRANCYAWLQEYAKALPDYDQAIRLKPDDASAYYNRGNTYHILGQYEQAIKNFTEAIRLQPDYASAYVSRGVAYGALGQYEKEIQEATEAIRLQPDYMDAYFNRGVAYGLLGQQEQAIKEYTKAIHLQSEYASAYIGRGNAYGVLGQHEQALKEFTEAIRLQPDYANAYDGRGNIYGSLGQHEQAIQEYTEAIRLQPDYANAYFNRGVNYSVLGQHEQAIQDYTEVIYLQPDYANAYHNRGASYGLLGQHEQALQDYTEAIRLKPDDAGAYYNRGLTYGALSQYEQAIKEYTEAIGLKPVYADAYFNRGNAYQSLQKYDLAIADFENFLTINEDPYWRKEAERHLKELRN